MTFIHIARYAPECQNIKLLHRNSKIFIDHFSGTTISHKIRSTGTGYNRRIHRKAISYTYPLLPRLGRYVNNSKFRIDNNLLGNAIRPLAIGRKNFLFCGNHDAAIRAAIVYSLISSCKPCGFDPRKWMEDVLLKITPYLIENRDLAELLPNHWASSTPTQSN